MEKGERLWTLQKTLHLFAENAAAIDKGFRFEKEPLRHGAALICTLENKSADCGKIRERSAMIKRHAPLFSRYRSAKLLSLSAYLAFLDNSEPLFRLYYHQQNHKGQDHLWGRSYPLLPASWLPTLAGLSITPS
jgi:hypothetical protein